MTVAAAVPNGSHQGAPACRMQTECKSGLLYSVAIRLAGTNGFEISAQRSASTSWSSIGKGGGYSQVGGNSSVNSSIGQRKRRARR